jgi:hypothetical protein
MRQEHSLIRFALDWGYNEDLVQQAFSQFVADKYKGIVGRVPNDDATTNEFLNTLIQANAASSEDFDDASQGDGADSEHADGFIVPDSDSASEGDSEEATGSSGSDPCYTEDDQDDEPHKQGLTRPTPAQPTRQPRVPEPNPAQPAPRRYALHSVRSTP